jgi:hypothetical protein
LDSSQYHTSNQLRLGRIYILWMENNPAKEKQEQEQEQTRGLPNSGIKPDSYYRCT